jgi:hypothetical protein
MQIFRPGNVVMWLLPREVKSLIHYSFPFDPELRATNNFPLKWCLVKPSQKQCSYLELKTSRPRQRPLDPYTQKTVVRPKTIEKKNKNKQTRQCGPPPCVRRCSLIWDRYPMARRPLYFYYLMLWKNGAFLPKISNPRFKLLLLLYFNRPCVVATINQFPTTTYFSSGDAP